MTKMNSLTRSMYKKLFAACQRIDRDPALRTLLTGFSRFHPAEETTEARMRVAELVTRCNGGAEWFVPHQSDASLHVTPCLREAFRDPERNLSEAMAAIKYLGQIMRIKDTEALVSEAMPEPLEGGEALASSQVTDASTMYIPDFDMMEAEAEAAREAARVEGEGGEGETSASAGGGETTEGADEASPVAQLRGRNPMLLVAHPLLEGDFQECVMVIGQHDEQGTCAFILNHPLKDFGDKPLILKRLLKAEREGAAPRRQRNSPSLSPAHSKEAQVFDVIENNFANESLYYGGPVYLNCLRFVHTHATISASRPLGGGLYSDGSAKEIVELLRTGEATVNDFLPVCGEACWAPKQLEAELEQGVWLLAEGTPELFNILKLNREVVDSGDFRGESIWRETVRRMQSEGDIVPHLSRIHGAWRHADLLAGRTPTPPEHEQDTPQVQP